jgi:hypothetical protein
LIPRKKALAACIAALIIALALIASSESFQDCEHTRKSHHGYQALQEEVGFLVHGVIRLKLHAACARVALGENDGAIAALSGIAVAFFTYTLWRSTEKLWQAAEAQRAADSEARRADLERLDVSLRIAQEHTAAAQTAADAAKAQTRSARREFNIDQRPWCSIEILPASDLTCAGRGDAWRLEITTVIKNHGKMPALNVLARFKILKQDGNDPETEQARLEDYLVYEAATGGLSGATVFPGAEFRQTIKLVHRNLPEAGKPIPIEPPHDSLIIGCIVYTFPLDGVGKTRFCCTLLQRAKCYIEVVGMGYGIETRGRSYGDVVAKREDLIFYMLPQGNAAI